MSSVGRNIPRWRSKGAGLSGCTQLGHAGQGQTGKKKKQVVMWKKGKEEDGRDGGKPFYGKFKPVSVQMNKERK